MICVFNKSGKWAGWHLHSRLTAALIWILNHSFTHFINEHVPSSALQSSPERKLSELFLNSEFLSEKQPLVLIFFFPSGTELRTSYLILETDSGSCRYWHGQPFFALPCLVSFTAPANTTLCRPLQPRFTSYASPLSSAVSHAIANVAKKTWRRKKQVNVISLGTPPWALCYCHICRHIIDFYTVAWKESLIDQNLEVLLSRQWSWQVRWK